MEKNKQNNTETGYPIGVVARLTGIQPTTLRIWERRYRLVEPVRSEGRNRRYSDADIQRLSLVKTLVDAGHQISTIASMNMEQLQARLDATSIQALKRPGGDSRPCRVIVLGSALAERIKDSEAHAKELDLVGSFADEDEIALGSAALAPEVLIIELATIHNDTLGKVRRLLAASGARQAVVIYGFGSRQALDDLAAAGVVCLRAPADLSEVASACRNAVQAPLVTARAASELGAIDAIPPRKFTPEQLAHFAKLVPTIACECPHHLVDLINSLTAFETYSLECQNRTTEDAEIHAFLHQIAGHSRAMFERALERVAEFEGIPLT
jgi:DNA-binding transcriptional MerR regulator